MDTKINTTGEKVEAVAWRWKGHNGAWVYEEGNATKREMREYDDIIVEDLYSAATIVVLEAERDEALSARKTDELEAQLHAVRRAEAEQGERNWRERATAAESALAAANAQVERYRTALHKIDALDEAMGHELRKSHAFEAVAIARAALTGAKSE